MSEVKSLTKTLIGILGVSMVVCLVARKCYCQEAQYEKINPGEGVSIDMGIYKLEIPWFIEVKYKGKNIVEVGYVGVKDRETGDVIHVKPGGPSFEILVREKEEGVKELIWGGETEKGGFKFDAQMLLYPQKIRYTTTYEYTKDTVYVFGESIPFLEHDIFWGTKYEITCTDGTTKSGQIPESPTTEFIALPGSNRNIKEIKTYTKIGGITFRLDYYTTASEPYCITYFDPNMEKSEGSLRFGLPPLKNIHKGSSNRITLEIEFETESNLL